ncbi:MAG: hypothetical protein M3P50_01975 [Actinomycetota bacterium]|nr:hypothetical protein [Actinomycetota bacterium]
MDGERAEGVAQDVEDDRLLLRAEVADASALEGGAEGAPGLDVDGSSAIRSASTAALTATQPFFFAFEHRVQADLRLLDRPARHVAAPGQALLPRFDALGGDLVQREALSSSSRYRLVWARQSITVLVRRPLSNLTWRSHSRRASRRVRTDLLGTPAAGGSGGSRRAFASSSSSACWHLRDRQMLGRRLGPVGRPPNDGAAARTAPGVLHMGESSTLEGPLTLPAIASSLVSR